ncbi:MAG TPA: SOS response-associated peptidase [Ornithinimicrobium sp.]|uniref:SOS response-associated peptidase n=1 Tax=Ornithinimicrobium sp. TaxID=1977084 RepID=UPI002B493BDA|nr:SOS response-associated peptidase [Ornithinimicrobium sp.]HKJ13165.1 SOS response-associated peptidase [Ornithinimicrobium sp.]
MCGRYAASAHPHELIEIFEVDQDASGDPTRSLLKTPQEPPAGRPDYNVAPSKAAPVVVQRPARADRGESRQLRLLSWGLVPPWSTDTTGSVRMINARAETLLSKPAFAKAARSRRCLVPATGWYEWQASPVATGRNGKPRKQPFFLTRSDDTPLALAGVYEFWKVPSDEAPSHLHGTSTERSPAPAWLVTFAIVTTAAEAGLDRIHSRQPVVLDEDRWRDWLDPGLEDADHIDGLLGAPAPGRFTAWPVSTAVNAVSNNSSALIEPLPSSDLVGVLDPQSGEVIGSP